jgi:hypothetical protein
MRPKLGSMSATRQVSLYRAAFCVALAGVLREQNTLELLALDICCLHVICYGSYMYSR